MKEKKISFTGYRKYRLSVLVEDKHDSALSVPCGTCSACCSHYKSITIHTHEMNPDWILAETPDEEGMPRLKINEDGSCVYLSINGCSIYESRPYACRIYDCRDFSMSGIQPPGPVGIASAEMAEKTLTAKTKADWDLLGAMRMAAWAYAAENLDNTAEGCAGSALAHADKYAEISAQFNQYVEHLKRTDQSKFESMVEELQQFFKQHNSRNVNEMIEPCRN